MSTWLRIAVLFLLMETLVADYAGTAKHADDKAYLIHHGLPALLSAEALKAEQQLLGPALNVTVHSGQDALLTCVAPHLGEKTVSWIRQRDLGILVSGRHVYTSDQRMASFHPEGSDLWGLQISKVEPSDEGLYQCQVNTDPKLSRNVVLIVLDQDPRDSPTSSIESSLSSAAESKVSVRVSDALLQAEDGSFVNMSCSASFQGEKLSMKNVQLSWWHGNSPISERVFEGKAPSLEITQVFGTFSATSYLIFKPVQLADTGTYYCRLESRTTKDSKPIPSHYEAVVKLNVFPKTVFSTSSNKTPKQRTASPLVMYCMFLCSIFNQAFKI